MFYLMVKIKLFRPLITFSFTASIIRKKTKDKDHVGLSAYNLPKRNNLKNETSQRSIIRRVVKMILLTQSHHLWWGKSMHTNVAEKKSVQNQKSFIYISYLHVVGDSRGLSNINHMSFEGSQDPTWVMRWLATPVNKEQGSWGCTQYTFWK